MIALVTGVAFAGLQLGAQQPEPSGYLVGPQDVLQITVLDEPELSDRFTVDGDGTITVPLLPSVSVDGLTVREIQVEIARQLGDGFLVNPQGIDVEEYRSQAVYVLGEVVSPGIYRLLGNLTLIEAIVMAGGLTEHTGDLVQIFRSAAGRASAGPVLAEDGDNEIEEIRLEDIRTGRLTFVLRGGDTVNVPPYRP